MSDGYKIIKGVAPLDGYSLHSHMCAGVPGPLVLSLYKADGRDPILMSDLWIILTDAANMKANVELTTLHFPNQVSFPPLVEHKVRYPKSRAQLARRTLELVFEGGGMSFSFEQAFS